MQIISKPVESKQKILILYLFARRSIATICALQYHTYIYVYSVVFVLHTGAYQYIRMSWKSEFISVIHLTL